MDRGRGLMGVVFYFVFDACVDHGRSLGCSILFLIFFLLMGLVVDRGWVHGGRSVVDGS